MSVPASESWMRARLLGSRCCRCVTHFWYVACFWALAAGSDRQNGATLPSDASLVMEGHQFRDAVLNRDGSVDYAAFNAIWPNLRVLARCSPKDKYTIVRGEVWGQVWCHMGTFEEDCSA